MASAILHIKDSYYFEVPKFLVPRNYGSKADFPDIWVRLDDDFQAWEASRLYNELAKLQPSLPSKSELLAEYAEWKHDHANLGKPFDKFLEQSSHVTSFFDSLSQSPAKATQWERAKEIAGGNQAVKAYKADVTREWSTSKLDAYNHHLSGKILIPQPFGELANFYEKESGFCISKFMVIEVAIALILCGLFAWLGRRVETGERPRGRLWNLLEVIVVYIRDQVARPAIGGGGHDDGHGHEHGHGGGHEADRFVPLLLTIFFFILACNLFGMLPWLGAPTGSWGVTFGLACVTFATVIVSGMRQFGPVGFFLNQVPHMDLPLPLAILLKPMILAIELLGLCIKHLVLSIRLLANMVAGHIVLLSIMMMAFSLEGALSPYWSVTAVISIFGSTLISCLELFVAFLQAYIFTFLSALFIGAAIHHH